MDRLGHFEAEVLPQRVGEHGAEGLLLGRSGHGRFRAKEGLDQLLVELRRLLGVVQGVVEIGRPVVKGREEKAQGGIAHNGTAGADMELVGLVEKPQVRRGVLHRADGAEDIAEHLVGALGEGLVIGPLMGHVVAVRGQEDDVIGVRQVQGLDDGLIEGLPGFLVLAVGPVQGGEQGVLPAPGHLGGGEGDVHQVPVRGPAEAPSQAVQIDRPLLLLQHGQGAVQVGYDLPVGVDKAAVEAGDVVLLRLQSAPELSDFFLVHSLSSLVGLRMGPAGGVPLSCHLWARRA